MRTRTWSICPPFSSHWGSARSSSGTDVGLGGAGVVGVDGSGAGDVGVGDIGRP